MSHCPKCPTHKKVGQWDSKGQKNNEHEVSIRKNTKAEPQGMNVQDAEISPLLLTTLMSWGIFLTRLSADATTKADAVITTHRKNILQIIRKRSMSLIIEAHLL